MLIAPCCPYEPITTLDARDATPPPLFQVQAPENAPNVLVVLLDDLGFGGTSQFGGPIPTPTFDRLAENGLFYKTSKFTDTINKVTISLKR